MKFGGLIPLRAHDQYHYPYRDGWGLPIDHGAVESVEDVGHKRNDLLARTAWRTGNTLKFSRAYAIDDDGNLDRSRIGPRALWLAELVDAFAPDAATPEETTMAPGYADYEATAFMDETWFSPPPGWSFDEWRAR